MADLTKANIVTRGSHPELWKEMLEFAGQPADSEMYSDMEGKEIIDVEPDQEIRDDYEALRAIEEGAIIKNYGFNPEKNKSGWAWVEFSLFSDTSKLFTGTLPFELAKQVGHVVPFNDLPAGSVYPLANDGNIFEKACIRTTKPVRRMGRTAYKISEWKTRGSWESEAAEAFIEMEKKNASKENTQAVARALRNKQAVLETDSVEDIMARHGLKWRDESAKAEVLESLHS